ncbi:MAG: 2-C-methyl-D-erythritol 4-phosphate cytidylyltransferase [Oscillospiraceae bacterium]|jgi:2-C-methyl-D-erythritol 4-phosphate cytidylyltransferase|nr:2-C-methyl-D-erythritol 4-phosphate cytidylyltransferase [Oscillospiraceae bacterium]
MIIAAILAGGIGSRMGNVNMPKQFLQLGSRPVLVHTIEKFLVHPQVDRVVVLTPGAWLGFTQDTLAEHLPAGHNVAVIEGGDSRNNTLRNALRWVEDECGAAADPIIITHDAVRPFVSHRIISDNIAAAEAHGACDTVIAATDTIVRSDDGAFITVIPPRGSMYQGQTPQSFRCNKLRALMNTLLPEEEAILTDACKIFSIRSEPVALVQGETHNLKITYPYDLKVAHALLGVEEARPSGKNAVNEA